MITFRWEYGIACLEQHLMQMRVHYYEVGEYGTD
jgi:hypothetical protein